MVLALDASGTPQPLERDLTTDEPAEGGAEGLRQMEDERDVDRTEKERRSPPAGRRARERKARARRR